MRLRFEYWRENLARTLRLWGHLEMVLLALLPALLAAIAATVARIERPENKGLVEAAREIFRDQAGDVIFVLLVALAVFFLMALLFINPMEMWVEERRRSRTLETPAVVLDRSSTGAIKLSFSEGSRVSQVVGQIRLSVQGAVPVRVERILAVPRVMFYRQQGSGGTNSVALNPEPLLFQPAHRGHDWGYAWNVGDEQWELDGLPITVQPGEGIELPVIRVVVQDAAEAERLLAERERTVLEVDIRVYTSVGIFQIAADKPIVGTRMVSSTPDAPVGQP